MSTVSNVSVNGLVRGSDPVTSREAAAGVQGRLVSDRAVVLEALREVGPCTDEVLVEFAQVLGLSPSGVRTRRCELVRAGLVLDTGRVGRTVSGRRAIVWGVA
jgi:hypothetical protein